MVELWNYRELLWTLTVVQLKNRYQNTSLGFLWSLIAPLLLALVMFLVFRYLWGQGPEFPAYLLVGLMTWRFFANSASSSIYGITGKPSLVTRVHIPRVILVVSNVLANLISSLLEFIIIIPLIYVNLGHVPYTVFIFPFIFLIYFWFVLGVGLFLASIYVYLRDINYVWDVVSFILFFLCPIFYPLVQISSKNMPIYLLNPLTEFMIMYRDVMIYGNPPTLYSLAITVSASIISMIIGGYVFFRLERRFAEEL